MESLAAKGSRNAKIKYNKKYLLEDNGAEKKTDLLV